MKTSEFRTRKTVLILLGIISVVLLVTIFTMLQVWNLLRENSREVSGIGLWVLMGLSYAAVGLGCYILARWISKSQTGTEIHEKVSGHNTTDRQQNEMIFQRYRLLSENTRDIILFIRASDGQILEANQAAVQTYGYELQDLVTKNVRDLRAPETRQLVEQQLEQAKAAGIFFETLHQRKDGSIFPVEINSVSVTLDGEQVLLSILRNMTERRQSEKALKESEDKFRSIVEKSLTGIFMVDDSYHFVYVNDELCRILGYPKHELTGLDFRKILSENSRVLVVDRYIRQQQGEDVPSRYELQVVNHDGQSRDLEMSATVMKDIAGEPRIIGHLIDITERKRVEEMIKSDRERFQTILETIRVPTLISRLSNGEVLYANQAIVQVSQVNLENLIGFETLNFYAIPDDRKVVLNELQQHGYINDFEVQFRRRDGSLYWALLSSRIFNYEGEPCVLSTYVDITERKKVEEKLRISEERYRMLAQNLPDSALFLYDQDLRFIIADGPEIDAIGFSRKMLEGKTLYEALSPESAQLVEANMLRTLAGDKFSAEIPLKDRFYRYSCVPLRDSSGTVSMGLILATNITEHKRTEKELEESVKRLQIIISGAPIVLYSVDRNGIFTLSEGRGTPAGESIFDNVVGKSVFDVLRDQPENLEHISRALAGEVFHATVNIYGQYFEAYHSPMFNEQGNCVGTIGVLMNITQRKQAEEIVAKRAAELATVAEIGTAASTILDTRILLQNTVDLTRERFNLYHAHIYLLNNTGDVLVLTAGAGDIGRQMVSNGHSISINREHSLVARAARTHQSVVINDITQSLDFLLNPLLPETRSEMSIPLVFGDHVLGVLDVQSDQVNHFSGEDVNIHSTLAAQIANSIQNAYQYQRILATASRLEGIQNAINEGAMVAITDAGSRIEFVNENMLIASGYTREELVGQDLRILNSNYHEEEFIQNSWETVSKGKVWRGELGNRSKGGTVYWVDTTLSPILNEKGESIKCVSVGFDITQRKHAESALRESQQMLRTVLDQFPGVVYWKDRQSVYLGCNQAWAMATGLARPEDIVGKNDFDLPWAETEAMAYRADDRAVMDTGQPRLGVIESQHRADGSLAWLDTAKVPLVDERGHVIGVLGTSRDITEQVQTLHALQETEFFLNRSQKVARIGSYKLDVTSGSWISSPSLDDILGIDIDFPKTADDWLSLVAPDDRNMMQEHLFQNVLTEHQRFEKEYRIIRPSDGKMCWVSGMGELEFDETERPVRMIGTIQDITERKKAESALQQATLIVENSPVILFRWKAVEGWPVVLVSQNIIQYGYSPEDLLSGLVMFTSIVHPDDLERVGREVTEYTAKGVERFTQEYRIVTKDDRIRWVEDRTVVERDVHGLVTHYQGIVVDVTDRKQAEMALLEKSEELDRFFSSALDLLCIADTDGHFLRLNAEWERSLGYSVSELVGRKFIDFVHPEDQSATLDAISTLRGGEEVFNFINRYRCKEGNYRWIEWRSLSAGNLIYAAARDITERKQMEDKLRESEERLQQAIRVSNIGIFDHDQITDIIYWSPEVRNSYGIGLNETFTLPDFINHLHPDDLKEVGFAIQRAHDPAGDGLFDVEYRFVRRDGSISWFAAKSQTFFGGDGDTRHPVRTIGALIDITERKQMDDALRESRNLLRTVLDTIPVRIFWKDTDLRFLGCNQPFALDAGVLSSDEIIGKDDYQLNWPKQADLYRRDDHQVLESGIPRFNYEELQTTRDGRYIWLRTSKVPLKGADGAIRGILGTYEDITERKRIEEDRETLIEELETKNAELERFTYTVSHDLKAPLVTIKGFLGFIKQDIASGNMERFDSDLERIGNATKKMEQLLRDLLELSRIGRMLNPMEKIPFDDLIREAMEIVHGRLEARKIMIRIQPDLPVVYGDRQRLVEVMQNLLDNAGKYMGNQEKPHIEIGLRGSDNGKLIFFVSDNGMGIAPEHHTRVFGLFNKLDIKSEGTGVGLALIKRIIEFHGGSIWIESELGKGSTFLFTLPMSPSQNP